MAADMNDPVYKEIVTARIKLLLEKPFFGNLATRLVAVEAPWCRTAATDGRHLYYNREFVKGLSRPHLLFLIAHEVYHAVFDHLGRRGSRDPKIWNMACLAWDTPILMADGSTQPIQRILPGDLIASPLGVTRVLGNMFSGIKPTMEYGVGDKRIRSTSDHKYASNDGNFTNASEIINKGGYGYVLRETGCQNVYSGESQNSISHGVIGSNRSGIQFDSELSGQKRLDSEQVFAKAVQLAAMSIIAAERIGLSGGNNRRRGNDYRTEAREIRSTDDISQQYLFALEGLVGGSRLLLSGSEEQTWTPVLLSDHIGMGNRSSFETIASVSRDQAAARALLATHYGNPEIAATSWAASGGSLATGSGDFRLECSRFSVGEGSAALSPVFDLITEAGSFFANGILTHNCDYVINYSLVREKVGSMPEMGLYDAKYTDEMSADEVYELLKKNSVTIKMPLDDHLDLGDDSDEGDGDDDGDPISKDGSNKRQGGSGDEDQDGKSGKGKGQPRDGSGDDPMEGGSQGQGKPGKGKGKKPRETEVTVMGKDGPPKLTEADMQKIRNDLKAAVIQTAQQVGAGNVPLGVKRLISELVEPKLDWRTLLDAHIRSQVKDDYTFQRLSRRTWGTGAIMPAQNFIDRVECWCAIDASGSTSETMLTHFLSEVLGVMNCFRDYKIGILAFDTEVYNVYEITPENQDDIHGYTIKGGGGTLFEAPYEYWKREGIEPNRIIFLTDGLPNQGWGDPDYAPTIFVIHSNPHISAPHGLTCHISDDDPIMRKK